MSSNNNNREAEQEALEEQGSQGAQQVGDAAQAGEDSPPAEKESQSEMDLFKKIFFQK